MFKKPVVRTVSERALKKDIPEEYFDLKHRIHDRLLDLIDLTVIEKLDQMTIKSQIRKIVESILNEDGHAVPLNSIEVELREDLGDEPEAVFTRFDVEPLAAASIAQVHRAQLKDGTEVIVKIRHPDIRNVIEADLRLLTAWPRWSTRTGRRPAGAWGPPRSARP